MPALASAAPPVIEATTFSHVTTSSATLEAKVSSGKAGKFRFEYGLGDCASNPCESAPLPEGKVVVGKNLLTAPIEGLMPGTTYHFRVVANNGEAATGPDTTLATYQLPQAFKSCPNDSLRTGHPSDSLPDCRAYEQASPVQKDGVDARGRVPLAKASPDGNRVTFVSAGGIPGAEGTQEVPTYLATRSDGNWSSQGLLPPETAGEEAFTLGWTPDFSSVYDAASRFDSQGGASLLARSSADGSLAEVVSYGSGLSQPAFAGATTTGSEVFFESLGKLSSVPAAVEGQPNLYVWDRESNAVSLAGVLNGGGAPTGGGSAGAPVPKGSTRASYTQDTHAVTADGSVYFTDGNGHLYLRRNPTQPQSPVATNGQGEEECTKEALACTLDVSASRKDNGRGPDGTDVAGTQSATFQAASIDGSKAFFTSSEKLTDDATTGPEPPEPTIARANSDGSAKNLGFLPATAAGIAVGGEFIYWANSKEGTIGRAKVDGTEVEEEFIKGLGKPVWVAVDSTHIYWSTDVEEGAPGEGKGLIGRAGIDGNPASVEAEFIKGASDPQGIAVDASHIYWANDGTQAIARAGIGGASPEPTWHGVPGINEVPTGVAVDATHIYWTTDNGIPNSGDSFINRADLDGSNEIFRGISEGHRQNKLKGIALDASHVYWVAQATETIGRMDLNLSEGSVERNFITGAERSKGLALDASHIYWSANGEILPNPGSDLYRYDTSMKPPSLSDLTVDHADVNGAEVQGVLGTSSDGSYVYFAANGVLATGASKGDCRSNGGECNIYVEHEGVISFVARVEQEAGFNWVLSGVGQSQKTSRVSHDGSTLLFLSDKKLSTYDNDGTPELYRYRVGEPGVLCVSCNPSGNSPVGPPTLGSIDLFQTTPVAPYQVLSRNLSADGDRVFFESTDKLVGADTNGENGCPRVGAPQGSYLSCQDVYEWEAKGTGSCESEAQDGGCIYLLSTGKSDLASFFADASESGDDAFIVTVSSGLVEQDQDQLYDVFDVSANGGLASQNEPPKAQCEGTEACHLGTAAPPAPPAPGSATFSGPGNPKPPKSKACPKGKRKVRSKGKTRCVKKGQKHQKQSKKAGRASR